MTSRATVSLLCVGLLGATLVWSQPSPDDLQAAPDVLAVRTFGAERAPDALPYPLSQHAAVAWGGKLFVFGGWTGGAWTREVLSLDAVTGRWTPEPTMPSVRATVAAAPYGRRIAVAGGPVIGGSGWDAAGRMNAARFRPRSLLLRDGRVFVAGGFSGDITSLASTEIYDPTTGIWTPTASMSKGRYDMTFVELQDGRILAAGGREDEANMRHVDIADSEIYDPRTGLWAPTGSLRSPRSGAVSFLRPDGTVLVAGGTTDAGIAGTELFDPRTGTWRAGPPMRTARNAAAGVRLSDGRFLVTGGNDLERELSTSEIYDPATDRWGAAAPMNQAQFNHVLVPLPDGRVMAVGGMVSGGQTRTTEIFDPAIDAWTLTSPPRRPHASGRAVAFDGKVLLVGGQDTSAVPEGCEIFDPATGLWSPFDSLRTPRILFGLVTLKDGDLLAFGGGERGYPAPALSSAERLSVRPAFETATATYQFSPGDRRWTAGPSFTKARNAPVLIALGRSLLAFGGAELDFESLEAKGWKTVGALPHSFRGAAVTVHDGKAYAARGGDFSVYDPSTREWSALSPVPTQRVEAAAASLGGEIYVVGGGASGRKVLGTVEAYDPSTGRWAAKRPLPRPVRGASATPLGGKLFVVGGGDGPNRSSTFVQVYDPKTDAWSLSNGPASAPTPSRPSALPSPPVQRDPVHLVAPGPRYAPKGGERPHDFALLVGVGYYKNLPAADFAESDAREMAAAVAALGVPEENVVVLTGAKASLSEISKYVQEWLPRRVSADSRVYFYFSGHGAPDLKEGSAYLMPWDGDAAFVKSTGYPLARLYASLGELPVARVLAMIDSCFSGAGGRSVLVAAARPLVTVKLPSAPPAKITVITASESEEIAGSLPERGHGLFSYHLLQGLGGAAESEGSGHLTVEELFRYVRKRVILDARRQNREQTPTLIGPDPKLKLY